MNDDFDIELQENNTEESNHIQLPMNILLFGEVESDDIKVYIKQDVYKALEKYALADVEHERGTIILGDFCEELGKTHVVISNYIEAKYTDASASTLTFTHETWDYVHKEHDAKYADKKIVGWQHTHPGYGIFLSNYDLFIQKNFFNIPFQVAYVIDPIQNIRGFFQWKNGKIEKLKGYYIYDDIGKPIKIEQVRKEKVCNDDNNSTNRSKVLTILVSLLCVVSLVLGISTISLKNLYNKQLKSQEQIIASVQEQESTIKKQENTIAELQEQLLNNVIDGSGKSTAKYLLERLENNEIKLNNQSEVIEELKALIENDADETHTIRFITYTVKSGDTLTKICNSVGINYSKNFKTILSINGIEDPNCIYVGQSIILPCIKQ